MAILAAGVGFSIRGGIFGDWGKYLTLPGCKLGPDRRWRFDRILLRHSLSVASLPTRLAMEA